MTQKKYRKVLAFGTFDHFHKGHEDFLRQASLFGDSVIVVIARDLTVEQVKGQKPEDSEKTRLSNVLKSSHVSSAVLGGHGDKYEVVRQIDPDCICLGYDQTAFTSQLSNEFPGITIKRLNPYQTHRYKSSYFRKKK